MKDTLQHIAIMITEHCNHDCYHCFRHVSSERSSLNLNLLTKLSRKLEGTSVTSIRITGGEPFLIKDLDKIIFSFASSGLKTSIGTNATLLNEKKIESLKVAGLNDLWVTVHSANENNHDKLSGKTGSFKLAIDNIKHCLYYDLNVNVNFPVSIYNLGEVLETLVFLDNLGVNRIKLLRLTPIGKASIQNAFNHITDRVWLDLAKKIKTISFSKVDFKMQGCPPDEQNVGKCTIYPFKHMNLSPSGYIYPCCLLNNRKGMEIGHISELLNGDWKDVTGEINGRIKQKYDLSINPIPCITMDEIGIEKKLVCPLYSKNICFI